MSSSKEDVRQQIENMHEKIESADYYEVLGVKPSEVDANPKVATKKFRKLAKKWHADRFKQHDLDDATTQKLRQIFARINKAHEVLTDEEARQDYDAEREGHEAEEFQNVIDSEQTFLRGKNVLETGNFEAAAEHFEKALKDNPEEGQYRVFYLYTQFLGLPKDRQGLLKDPESREAVEIRDEMNEFEEQFDEHDWMHQFLGVIAQGFGNWDKAKRYFRKAKKLNSDNRDAKRRLRLLNMREQKDSNDSEDGGNLLDKVKNFFEEQFESFR